MPTRLVISLLWLVLSIHPLRAQLLAAAPDSLPVHLARPLVVTATRFAIPGDQSPAPVHTIDRDRIDLVQPSSLAELLQHESGAGLTSYGGAGSLQLLSYRGMGPEYTAIFVNGMRINDMQNGLVDAGRIPLATVERIEAAPGGFSALYGSGAMGAVVNITTLPSSSLFQASAGSGSFGWSRYHAQAGLAGSAGAVSLSFQSERAKNDFSFASPLEPPEKRIVRENADFTRRQLLFDGRLQEGSSLFNLTATYANSDVGVPGPYTGGAQGSARQSDEEVRSAGDWKSILGGANLLHVGASFFHTNERYADPQLLLDGAPLDSRYENDQAALSGTIEGRVAPRTRAVAGMEFLYARLRSGDIAGMPERVQGAAFLSAEQLICARDGDTTRALRLFPLLRWEIVQDNSTRRDYSVLCPSLGFNLPLLPEFLTLRGKVDRNVRIPTFNQLYWKQGGNPALQPERSLSAEAGAYLSTPDRSVDLELTIFHQDVRDKIVWLPGSGIFWNPKNVQHVSIAGVAARARGAFLGDILRIEANGQWISARKLNSSFAGDITEGKFLPYVPSVSGNVQILASVGRFRFSISEELSGMRYTDEINSAANALPFHAVTNLAAQVSLTDAPAEVTLHLQAGNLFDQQYETIANCPMPPRWFRASVTVRYE